MSRSTAAFLIAILFHLLLILLIGIAMHFAQPKEKKNQPDEQRFKISLKPKPATKKSAAVKNKIKKPPPKTAPPMPRGKQLKKIVKPAGATKPLTSARQPIKSVSPKPVKPQKKIPTPEKIATKPIPLFKSSKVDLVKKEHKDLNQTEVPKEHRGLFSKLSKKRYLNNRPKSASNRNGSRISEDMRELYGDEFGKLSEGEQKYILDNQEIMRRITQRVLTRVGRVNIPYGLRVNTENIVEFYLYPNGDISDIRFLGQSGYRILDQTTRETIEYAYSQYPRPNQKTLIRYKVGYFLRGF